jgi:hypothetical protein
VPRGVRVTGIILLGVMVVGAVVRVVTALRSRRNRADSGDTTPRRLGPAGRNTIPFAGRLNAENDTSTAPWLGFAQQASSPGSTGRPITVTGVEEEETEVAIKEPGFGASPNRALAMTAGTMFVIWGFMGYFFAGEGGHTFVGPSGGLLWNAFLVNASLAAIWLLFGALLFIVGLGNVVGSRNANMLVGILCLFLSVYGFVFKNTSANIFAANTTDNVFHLVVGIVLVLTAIGADKQNIRAILGERRQQQA